MRVPFKTVDISRRFQMVRYRDEEGDSVALMDVVYVVLPDGRELFMPNVKWVTDEETGLQNPTHLYFCEVLVERIQAAGTVDLAHWVEIEQVSTEDRFYAELEREQMQRMGYD